MALDLQRVKPSIVRRVKMGSLGKNYWRISGFSC
jgi:hypothetical protein